MNYPKCYETEEYSRYSPICRYCSFRGMCHRAEVKRLNILQEEIDALKKRPKKNAYYIKERENKLKERQKLIKIR
jgi:hypothetical protein